MCNRRKPDRPRKKSRADITPCGGHNATDLCEETGTGLSGTRPTRLVPGPRPSPLSGDGDPTAMTGDGASADAAAKTCEYLLGPHQHTGGGHEHRSRR